MTTTEFNNQLSTYNKLFVGNALRLTGDRNNAKDLMQETVMRAYASCHKFTEGTNFKAWVYTIMQNNFINEYRKTRTRNHVMGFIEENTAGTNKISIRNNGPEIIFMKELRSFVDSLNDTNRIPFEMFTEGYSYLEIAEKLEIPIGTVKSRIFLARKSLKELIKGNYSESVRYA